MAKDSRGGKRTDNLAGINGRNDEETNFIKQLAKDFDLMPNGDVQAEAEAYVMRKVGAENIREVFNGSDRLLRLAREQQDIDYVNNLRIGESREIDQNGKTVSYNYSAYDYSNDSRYPKKVNDFKSNKKLTKKQVRQRILDDMTSIPLF